MSQIAERTEAHTRKLLVAQLLASHDALQATCAQIRVSLLALGVDVDALLDGSNSAGESRAATPDASTCPHPPDAIEDLASTFGAEGPYHCTTCGATQDAPFHTLHHSPIHESED